MKLLLQDAKHTQEEQINAPIDIGFIDIVIIRRQSEVIKYGIMTEQLWIEWNHEERKRMFTTVAP